MMGFCHQCTNSRPATKHLLGKDILLLRIAYKTICVHYANSERIRFNTDNIIPVHHFLN